ncbi:MAG: hypothetical protein AAF297_04605 [Planctomycetota bacterium]
MTPKHPIAWSVVAVSLAGLIASGYLLAKRIEAYHTDNARDLYYFNRTDQTEFQFAGRDISFDADLDDNGAGTVTLTSASIEDPADITALEIPVEIPTEIAFPGLERYADWMGVFFFAENERRAGLNEFRHLYKTGQIPLRLVVVVRDPNPGVAEDGRFDLEVDPNSWGFGEVMRHRWTFRFHEIKPDGSIETTERLMPQSGASFYRAQVRAKREGEAPPERAENELKEGTWRWDAALQVMPRAPAITKENQALLYAGWTLPASSVCALGVILGLAFAFAPPRTKAPEAQSTD